MIIKMVNEFKLIVFHLRAQTRCKSEHTRGFTARQVARQQNCVGFRATGPPGRRGPWAAGRGPLGLRAAGPLGRGEPWAVASRGPWRAVGRWAAGRWAAGRWAAGRWAAGLLLAKPVFRVIYTTTNQRLFTKRGPRYQKRTKIL